MSEGDSSFLVILLEDNISFWDGIAASGDLSPQSLVEQLLAFIRAYSLLDDGNKLALYTVGAAVASLPTAPAECIAPSAAGLSQPPTDHNKLADTAESTLERLRIALAHRSGDLGGSGPAAWSSALLRAMCFVNKSRQRIEERQTAPPARFLCIKGSGDDSGQYLAFMNAVFAAQRSKIIVDACVLGQKHSPFMQQACYLTGGAYIKPTRAGALLEYLLTVCAVDGPSREFLRLPKPASVDLRASCFCHKRPTALGFVCSVCLSIFCEKVPGCTTCGTEFT